MKDDGGNWLDSRHNIGMAFSSKFRATFSTSHSTGLDDLKGVITPRILNSTNCGLSALPTVDEIEFVAKEMNPRAG